MNRFFPTFHSLPQNILFVCTGNICRSVFAQGIMKKMLAKEGLEIDVHSAGTKACSGRKSSSLIMELLNKEGVDLSDHRTRKITPGTIEKADLVFVMENAHLQAVLTLSPKMTGRVFLLSQFYSEPEILPLGTEIPDPIGMNDFFYENVNDIIRLCCQNLLGKLKKEVPEAIGAEMKSSR